MNSQQGQNFEKKDEKPELTIVRSPDAEAERLGFASLESAAEEARDLVNQMVKTGRVPEAVLNRQGVLQQMETLANFLMSTEKYRALGKAFQMKVLPKVYEAAKQYWEDERQMAVKEDDAALIRKREELAGLGVDEMKPVSGGDDSWIDRGRHSADVARDTTRYAREMPAVQPVKPLKQKWYQRLGIRRGK
ncbi:TPA: hypothetical protein DF272_00360 [Candidatus Falkowbacteria bacterium]|nr:hypothetical protein [Candidatus Falkowbacteria bacterium]